MASNSGMTYYPAARHPWPCLVFVLPLMAAYEVGVNKLGGTHPETVRNGADNWLRVGLALLHLPLWAPPLLLLTFLVWWVWYRRADQPNDLISILSGMAIESVAFAVGLWLVSNALNRILDSTGSSLALDPEAESGLRQLITFLGAGIYEEALFRLALFSGLLGLLRMVEMPASLALGGAALASALLFSAAHHIGPYGQDYTNFVFLFRLAAGLYFAALYQCRGFGIAVGAHACYNVMVSVGNG
jgi:membrane protease YdiL (CAAX protease family)